MKLGMGNSVPEEKKKKKERNNNERPRKKNQIKFKLEHLCFIKHEYQPTISVL